jgi:hypothetical protein
VLEGQYASITIIINSEAELGILEIMNPDSNNVATFAISVLDDALVPEGVVDSPVAPTVYSSFKME